jgi:hypothetical protein
MKQIFNIDDRIYYSRNGYGYVSSVTINKDEILYTVDNDILRCYMQDELSFSAFTDSVNHVRPSSLLDDAISKYLKSLPSFSSGADGITGFMRGILCHKKLYNNVKNENKKYANDRTLFYKGVQVYETSMMVNEDEIIVF